MLHTINTARYQLHKCFAKNLLTSTPPGFYTDMKMADAGTENIVEDNRGNIAL
jgi:hypothetical protein